MVMVSYHPHTKIYKYYLYRDNSYQDEYSKRPGAPEKHKELCHRVGLDFAGHPENPNQTDCEDEYVQHARDISYQSLGGEQQTLSQNLNGKF